MCFKSYSYRQQCDYPPGDFTSMAEVTLLSKAVPVVTSSGKATALPVALALCCTLPPPVYWLLPPHVGGGLGSIYSGSRAWHLVPDYFCCWLLLRMCHVARCSNPAAVAGDHAQRRELSKSWNHRLTLLRRCWMPSCVLCKWR